LAFDFWDTSAIAKLYLNESGSLWAADRADASEVVCSQLVITEIASVLSRRSAQGEFDVAKRDLLYASFLDDAERWQMSAVTNDLLRRGSSIALSGRLATRVRALDLIQLASALEWFERARALNIEPGAFVVADRPLREAAVALGLDVENPEDHA
jgi:predicted nucleic acid-binding protein